MAFLYFHIAHDEGLHCCNFSALVIYHSTQYCSADVWTAAQIKVTSADKLCLSLCVSHIYLSFSSADAVNGWIQQPCCNSFSVIATEGGKPWWVALILPIQPNRENSLLGLWRTLRKMVIQILPCNACPVGVTEGTFHVH